MNEKGVRTFGDHIVQYEPEYSLCAGCTTCEIVCTLTHDGLVSPSYTRIFVDRGTRSMIHIILSCQHCSDHPCYSACPEKDSAMCIDENGIVYIDEENCIGCGLCIKACVFDPPRINMVRSADKAKRKAKKCDLCRTRPEGPACIQWCPVGCIGLSSAPKPEPATIAEVETYE
ncbi:MAG: 4Fe-4S dicluster domain-containing protein [Clostridiales bacterium]|nr:4Fe-4S dicluster domain-containing protein [Clostridiales bacterium]